MAQALLLNALALYMLLAGSGGGADGQLATGNATGTGTVTVFEALTGPFPCIRIPSALSLPDGSVLAFAECRRWAGDQCFVPSNTSVAPEYNRSICMKRSLDGGRSWGALQPNITQRYSANPSAVHCPATNTTRLFFNDARSAELYSVASTDFGASWGRATPLRNATGGACRTCICGAGSRARLPVW